MIIEINTQSPSPIYEQIRDQIVLGLAAKKLVPGEALPSVRNLAADLGINFHTVNKAYSMLCDEGYIAMDRRKGAMAAQAAPAGELFLSALSKRIILAAAEAVCHGMDAGEFASLCAECHKRSKGG
ncbi:MAG: GntR family transcriptional regulator [Oscillospiraceae bacterium]|nr:GntR family transcriptional regulator [Oscillospiraceae bacterium]